MEKITIKELNETIYHEVLDNGLNIYVMRKKNFVKGEAHFLTNFGGRDTEFSLDNEEMKKYPNGVAHFLEHKLFEQEKGISVPDYFKKSGTYFNAYTSNFITNYYFVGTANFKGNLRFLLDYVQSPYFTDENVLKEKGIIKEEILRGKDNIQRNQYNKVFENLFTGYPFDHTVIGEVEDINNITKEDLYECYNTFYHPSNMVLFVVSKYDEKEIINIVKENQSKKNFPKKREINRKEYTETDEVKKEYEVMYDKVVETRLCYSIKIKTSIFNSSKFKIRLYLLILFDIIFGDLSTFTLDLKTNNKILGGIGYSTTYLYDYLIIKIFVRPLIDEIEIIKLLEKRLNDKNIKEEDFELVKKAIISSSIYDFNTVSGSLSTMFNCYTEYNDISNEFFDTLKHLNYKEFIDIVNKLSIKNKSILVTKSKEEKKC